MGARPDYIPAFVKASDPSDLGPLILLVNSVTGRVQEPTIIFANGEWYAWFRAHIEDIERINELVQEAS